MPNESRKQCFVVAPIGTAASEVRNHSDWLLMSIIEPVFTERFSNFDVVRADKISEPGMIDSQIINRLIEVDLVVADMTFLNANAFYEIGIRHMAQKPIVHMFLEGTEIPFDVKPYRAISFRLRHPNDLEAAKRELSKAVEGALGTDHQVENPVTRARGTLKLLEHATPDQQVFLRELESLKERVAALSQERPRSASDLSFAVRSIKKAIDTLAYVRVEKLNDEQRQSVVAIAKAFGAKQIRVSISKIEIDFPDGIAQEICDAFEARLASTLPIDSIEWLPF